MSRLLSHAATAAIATLSLLSCRSGFVGESIPRGTPSHEFSASMDSFFTALADSSIELHSIMVVQHGKVIAEKWMNGAVPQEPHVMWSVSKTFTALATGLAIEEGFFKLDDKVVSFFPEDLPEEVSDNLAAMTVEDLLTMSCGHDSDPTDGILDRAHNDPDFNMERKFLCHPVPLVPGTFFLYNTLGTYMLSSIITRTTGQKLFDYLKPRIFEPLQMSEGIHWDENRRGVSLGGWGLYLTTEDMAKAGMLLLQKGKWNGKQLVPAAWIEAMSAKQIDCYAPGMSVEKMAAEGLIPDNCDWLWGYGYQMWRCRDNGFRADGAFGQFILVYPDLDATIAITSRTWKTFIEMAVVHDIVVKALK